MYVFGGYNGFKVLNDFFRFSLTPANALEASGL
jgi:hypothetical protein